MAVFIYSCSYFDSVMWQNNCLEQLNEVNAVNYSMTSMWYYWPLRQKRQLLFMPVIQWGY